MSSAKKTRPVYAVQHRKFCFETPVSRNGTRRASGAGRAEKVSPGRSAEYDAPANERAPTEGYSDSLEQVLIKLGNRLRRYSDPIERLKLPIGKVLGISKIVRPRHTHVVGAVNTDRFGSVEFVGLLQEAAVGLAHADPFVTMMIARPIEIPWRDARGEMRNHRACYALLRHGKIVIIDVEDDGFPVSEERRERMRSMEETIAMHGAIYEVWTASEIYRQPRANNISLLSDFRHHEPDEAEEEIVLDMVRSQADGVPISEIITSLERDPTFRFKIYTMIGALS